MRGDGSYLIFDKNEDGSYTAPDGYVYDLKAVSYKDTDHDYIGDVYKRQEPIFVQAKEAIEDVQKNADFSRPEALTEEEAGIRCV